MKNCIYCGKEFGIETLKGQIGGHIVNCKMNPKRLEAGKKISKKLRGRINERIKEKYKSFDVNCHSCGKEFSITEFNVDKPKKERYFCCRSCSNKFSSNINKEEKNKKISKALNKKIIKKDKKEIKIRVKKIFFCKSCGKQIGRKNKSGYCQKCLCNTPEFGRKISKALKGTGKTGGYKEKSGTTYSGWFKGIYCNSSWELAYLIFASDHNMEIERNKTGFPYIFEEKKFNFYPDFKIGEEYIEIKGYLNNKEIEKIKQFPHKLKVISKQEIKPYLEYVKQKYGEDFIKMYEK